MFDALYADLADVIGNPTQVYCRKCGRVEPVNAAECFRSGWPKCCRRTMTLDAQEATPELGADDGE